jgi:hypothetical protein
MTIPQQGDDHRTIAVQGEHLVLRADGLHRRAPISTLRAAGELVGIEPGAPSSVFKPIGAALTWDSVGSAEDAVDFFLRGRRQAAIT